MSELEDKISGILGDPAQMEKITKIARISRLMQSGSAQNKEEQALLAAMRPYLSEKRRRKMDRAMKLAQLARLARLAMGETEGDGSA